MAYSFVKTDSRGKFTSVVFENIYRAEVAIVYWKTRQTCDMEIIRGRSDIFGLCGVQPEARLNAKAIVLRQIERNAVL
jgi:hypothetical protein